MCSVPGTQKPQPNVTYKGREFSAKSAREAQQLTQAYNYSNAMGRAMSAATGRPFKAKPIKQTKYYHPELKAWDEYDASVQAAKNVPKSAPVADDPNVVLKTGSDLGQAKVRNKRRGGDDQAFGRAYGRAVQKMTIR